VRGSCGKASQGLAEVKERAGSIRSRAISQDFRLELLRTGTLTGQPLLLCC